MRNQTKEDIVLSIAIVNWNTSELTKSCIESILENTKGMNYEIIVVDNASMDNSVEVIEQNFPQVRLIKNNWNLGFAEPNNQALEISYGKYFLSLNSDTVVHGDALEQMVDFLDTHPVAGAVTCKLLNPDGTIQYSMHRRFPTFLGLASGYVYKRYPRFKTKWAREYLMLDNEFDKTEKIEQAGTCIMVRKNIIDDIGGLFDSKRFPIFFNDVDLCYRLHKNHFELYLLSDAFITHLKGQSVKVRGVSWQRREHAVSSLSFFKKHKKYLDYILSKMGYLFLYSFIALYSPILFLVKRMSFTSFKGRLSLPLSALVDKKIDL